MEKIENFKQLRVWQKGMEIVENVYISTKPFPKQEVYGLTSQIRRAAVSIPSNIAEGFERYSKKECIKFLSYSKGS